MRFVNETLLISGAALLLFLPSPAWAEGTDYGRLKQELSSHKTPSFYEQSVSQSSQKSLKQGITENDLPEPKLGLELAEKELKKQKEKWEGDISRGMPFDALYDFSSERRKKAMSMMASEKSREILKRGIDIDLVICAALERNPGLKGAKRRWSASLEKFDQVTQLDDLLRQYQTFVKDINTLVTDNSQKGSVVKNFPLPGVLTLKGDIAAKEVELAREKYAIFARDLITDIKNSYYELLYVGYAISITRENVQLLDELEKVAYIKYKAGYAGYSDVIKVQTRKTKMEDDLVTLRDNLRTVIAKLNEFMSLPPAFQLGPPRELDLRDTSLDLQELIDLGLKHQQEIKALEIRIKKTALAITMAETKIYPDFTVGYSYFQDEKAILVGSEKQGETFPLKPVDKTRFWFGQNDSYVREARQNYQALQRELESQKDKLRYAVKNKYFQLETARHEVLLYKDSLLLLAKSNLAVARTDYQSGKVDFLDVLDAQRIWLDYSLLYRLHIMHHNQSIANLEQVIGKELKK